MELDVLTSLLTPPPGFQEKLICAWTLWLKQWWFEPHDATSTACFLQKLTDGQDEVLALNQWPLNARLKDEVDQKEKTNKRKPIMSHPALSNPELIFWLAGDTAAEGQEISWGLEMPQRTVYLGCGNWAVLVGGWSQREANVMNAAQYHWLPPGLFWEWPDLQPQHPADMPLLRSSSVPLLFKTSFE